MDEEVTNKQESRIVEIMGEFDNVSDCHLPMLCNELKSLLCDIRKLKEGN